MSGAGCHAELPRRQLRSGGLLPLLLLLLLLPHTRLVWFVGLLVLFVLFISQVCCCGDRRQSLGVALAYSGDGENEKEKKEGKKEERRRNNPAR